MCLDVFSVGLDFGGRLFPQVDAGDRLFAEMDFAKHDLGIAQLVAYGEGFCRGFQIEVGLVLREGVGRDGGGRRARNKQVDFFVFPSHEGSRGNDEFDGTVGIG